MRIVLVSPSAAERSALHQLLVDDGHEVSVATTPDHGLELASTIVPDAFIADAQVLGIDGLRIVRALTERGLRARVILLCPRGRPCKKDGFICLTKPIDFAELRSCLSAESGLDSRVA